MKSLTFLAIIFCFLQTACENPFHDSSLDLSYPDTAVTVLTLSPQICRVKITPTDTNYYITSYWTEEATGRILYKMDFAPYINSRLHGIQMKFDHRGDTLLMAHFDDGIRVDSTVYKYPNGQVKQKFFYSKKRNGNILYEVNFHANGQRKSDVIQYNKGLINGAVTYYDSTARNLATETYYYVDSEIIGIKIYNEDYDNLARRKSAMQAAYQIDSARIAQVAVDNLEKGISGTKENVHVIYQGAKTDAMYDIGEPDMWDILKKDPDFILQLELDLQQ